MKKFFQNTGVAIAVLVICIIGAIVLGQVKRNANDGTVHDEIGMFTDEQIARLEIYNSAWESDYGCSIHVCTVKTTGSKTLEKYADKLCKSYDLEDADALLLISKKASSWYYMNAKSGEKLNSVMTGRVQTYLADMLDSGYKDETLDSSAVLTFFSGVDNVLAGRISDATLSVEDEPVVEDRYSASDWTDYINAWLGGGTNDVLIGMSGTNVLHGVGKSTGKLIKGILKIISGSSFILIAGMIVAVVLITRKIRRSSSRGNSISSSNGNPQNRPQGTRNANPYSSTTRQSARSGYNTNNASVQGQSHTTYNGGRHTPSAPGTRGNGGAGGQAGNGGSPGAPGQSGR